MSAQAEGDPGKLAYLHNRNWTPTPVSFPCNIDPRVCPGCLFPHAMRKHAHVDDKRCALFRAKQKEVACEPAD